MKRLWQTLFQRLTSTLRERVHLALTTMALRHQLAVLQRSAKRPQFRPADRCLWVLLSTVWARWPEALEIVQADTVRRWRRQGWWHHLRWWCGWKRPGRPAIASEMHALIRGMRRENVLWGAPRIYGELAKLGVQVSPTTVAKYMVRRPRPPSQTWQVFLRNHARDLIARGPYRELACRLHASSIKVTQALLWWPSSWTTSGGHRSTRRDAVSYTLLSAPATVPGVWTPDLLAHVRVPERSPPNVELPCHTAPVLADRPKVVRTADVCLAAWAMELLGGPRVIPQQVPYPTTQQARGASFRVAAG
jgi:hypothetical protein